MLCRNFQTIRIAAATCSFPCPKVATLPGLSWSCEDDATLQRLTPPQRATKLAVAARVRHCGRKRDTITALARSSAPRPTVVWLNNTSSEGQHRNAHHTRSGPSLTAPSLSSR